VVVCADIFTGLKRDQELHRRPFAHFRIHRIDKDAKE
jgi:hypothetical protein